MDSEIQRDGRVLDLTDDAWREDRLPYEDVTIPLVNLRKNPINVHHLRWLTMLHVVILWSKVKMAGKG